MENKQSSSKVENSEEITLEIVEKLAKELLTNYLNEYAKSANIEAYAKLGLFIFPVLILIHNVFIAGKSYEYSTYNNIKNIELTIVGVLVIALIILAVISIRITSKLTSKLKESSKRYGIKNQSMEEEFSILAVHFYGGRGVELK